MLSGFFYLILHAIACPRSVGRFDSIFMMPSVTAVHPHVCGEIDSPSISDWYRFGTSPRLWGDSLYHLRNLYASRYIPTSVGRFLTNSPRQHGITVHPHVCGEIQCVFGLGHRVPGTSPRLWGDFGQTRRRDGEFRSLRLWGDWKTDGPARSQGRYIPTSVGRFIRVARRFDLNQVHPHVCGEIHGVSRITRFRHGTSPRLWGD